MHTRRWARWALLALSAGGCQAKDSDTLARIGRKTAGKVEALVGPRGHLAGGWEVLRGSLSDGALDSRVAARLRWDRYLAEADIQAHSPAPGVVRLRGTVADAAHRQRALELARSTAGVEQVLDELTVAQ
jgi:osmotically-inducible protein OsmY